MYYKKDEILTKSESSPLLVYNIKPEIKIIINTLNKNSPETLNKYLNKPWSN